MAISRMVDTPGRAPVRMPVAFERVKQDRGRMDDPHWLSVVQGERRDPRPGRLTSGAAQTWYTDLCQPARYSVASDHTHANARQDCRRDRCAGLVGLARGVGLETELDAGVRWGVASGEDVCSDDADLQGSNDDLEECGRTHVVEGCNDRMSGCPGRGRGF